MALYYWPQVIGDKLIFKIKAERVTNGILWLKTNDPSLTQNLTFFRKQIIRKYNRFLGPGVVRAVRIVTGETGIAQKAENKKEKIIIKEKFKNKFPQKLEEIKDEELKDAFSHFFRYHSSLREGRLMNGDLECPQCGRLIKKNEDCLCTKQKKRRTSL